jgi:hypothetical protein
MTRIIELAAYAAAYLILARVGCIVITQAMWAMDKALGEDDESRHENR